MNGKEETDILMREETRNGHPDVKVKEKWTILMRRTREKRTILMRRKRRNELSCNEEKLSPSNMPNEIVSKTLIYLRSQVKDLLKNCIKEQIKINKLTTRK